MNKIVFKFKTKDDGGLRGPRLHGIGLKVINLSIRFSSFYIIQSTLS